ncbi:hypothetical protein yfred0001_7870 [Yersinia frederiksenii ATCC 33641]|nr:hypothetical protein yfred0001_7870 [Yersinia frederiksenii ATCC 33641]
MVNHMIVMVFLVIKSALLDEKTNHSAKKNVLMRRISKSSI